MGRILVVFALLLAVLAVTVMSDRPLPPADLTVIETVDPITLDPQRMSYQQDFRLCYALYEGLVRWDIFSEDFHVEPALARSWDISEDRLTYTFHLEPSARWSNGDKVTAQDLVYSWRRMLFPETSADYTAIFYSIAGALEFFEWRTEQLAAYARRSEAEKSQAAAIALRKEANERFAQTVGLRALDDHTLRVTLSRPLAYFLDLCAFGPFYPVHPPTVEKWVSMDPSTGAIRQAHGWTKPPYFVSNGPYVVHQWRFKRDLRMERNPYFWNPELARSDSISIIYIEDQNTSVLAYTSGSADWHSDVEVEYIGDLLDQRQRGERDDIHSFTTFGTYFWSFNCTPRLGDGRDNPFYDARVRRAFAMAVDKQALVRQVRRSYEKVANVFIPPGSIAGLAPVQGLPYDIARARLELADAGWIDRDGDGVLENPAGEAFPIVDLLATATGPHKDVALAMGRMWEEAFGVRIRISIKETKVYKDALKRRDYVTARGGWYGDYLDPTTFLDLHRTGDGNNDRGFSDPIFDDLLIRAEQELDPVNRMEILSEAERYSMEEALPILPLWHYDQYYMYKPPMASDGTPNVGGLRRISTHPRLVQYLFYLEVVRPDAAESSGAAISDGAAAGALERAAP